jgi:hypothetical protein
MPYLVSEQGKIIRLECDTSMTLGRSAALGVDDVKCSRNQAQLIIQANGTSQLLFTGKNPMSLMQPIGNQVRVTYLKKGSVYTLNHGDRFSMISDRFWFTYKTELEESPSQDSIEPTQIVRNDSGLKSNTNNISQAQKSHPNIIPEKVEIQPSLEVQRNVAPVPSFDNALSSLDYEPIELNDEILMKIDQFVDNLAGAQNNQPASSAMPSDNFNENINNDVAQIIDKSIEEQRRSTLRTASDTLIRPVEVEQVNNATGFQDLDALKKNVHFEIQPMIEENHADTHDHATAHHTSRVPSAVNNQMLITSFMKEKKNNDFKARVSPTKKKTDKRPVPGSMASIIESSKSEAMEQIDESENNDFEQKIRERKRKREEEQQSPNKIQKIDPEVIPNCQHGVPAFVRTVLKEGPTKGKQYYGCGLSSEKCSFFQWVGAPNCEHELPCTRQVVKKEGKNQGRNFWCCNQIDKCKTFRWIKDGE